MHAGKTFTRATAVFRRHRVGTAVGFMKVEMEKWVKVAKFANIKLD
jgi:hypothetical protein